MDSSKQLGADSTRSQKAKRVTSPSSTRLTPSEIESLRKLAKERSEQFKKMLKDDAGEG